MHDHRNRKPPRKGRPVENRKHPRPGRRERAGQEMGSRASETSETRERIAKRLARAGVASRREAESLIAAGRVRVNGKVLDTPALDVSRADLIELDGKPIPAIERTRLFLFHKPAGVVTTNRDPQGRRTVFDVLPAGLPRLVTVGRLDINTEGLLLLTNDGGLARVLELPATGWLRRYRVRVHGKVDQTALASLKDGIAVDGVFYGSVEAVLDREQGSNAWLTIGLREGKNREVKNILSHLGLEVTRLIRVSYGPFQLGELAESEVRELRGRMLRDQLGERLIAEAGADFDAPLVASFSARPAAPERASAPPPRGSRLAPEGEGGLVKGRGKRRESGREAALDRLSTRPPKGGKPHSDKAGKGGEKPAQPPRSRASNVWMAPGARPLGPKKAAERQDGAAERPGKPKQRPGRPDKPSRPDRPAGKRPGADRRR